MRKLQNLCGIVVALALVLSLTFVPAAKAQPPGPRGELQGRDLDLEITEVPVVDLSDAIRTKDGQVGVIVMLKDSPLATYKGGILGIQGTSPAVTGKSKLDVNSASSKAYLAYLDQVHVDFAAELAQVAPSAKIEQKFSVALNAVSMKINEAEVQELAKMGQVLQVYPDQIRTAEMDASLDLINAPELWAVLGGRDEAGKDMKIAVVDSGLRFNNPMFSNPGDVFEMPFGYPRGYCVDNPGDTTVSCNGKVIVARYFYDPALPINAIEVMSPLDIGGHGSHTAGTSAGNRVTVVSGDVVPADTEISGVAPGAYLMVYKGLFENPAGDNGSGTDTMLSAAMEAALMDGADVINNSWGGSAGGDPNSSVYKPLIDAITAAGTVVVFSAGNSGPNSGTIGCPGCVESALTVAASSTSRIVANNVDITGPTPVPANLVGIAGMQGTGPVLAEDLAGPLKFDETNVQGCSAFAAGTFTGSIALISRGTCGFVDKVVNAAAAGATGVIVYNSIGGPPIVMGSLETTSIPSVMISNADGVAVRDYVIANPTDTTVSIDSDLSVFNKSEWEDILASFSSVGPNGDPNVLKPDITAPGVNILSAFSEALLGNSDPAFAFLNGTSMSAPHVTGAVALMRQYNPSLTPAEIKSLLTSTSDMTVLMPDGLTPAGAFNMGAGRLDLGAAMDGGVVFGKPSFANGTCVLNCDWNTTIKNIGNASTTWNATVAASTGLAVSVAPSSFTLGAGLQGAYSVTADVSDLTPGNWYYATITWTDPSGTYPPAHQQLVVRPAASSAALSLSKIVSAATATPGSTLTYSINLSNNSAEDTTFFVRDLIPTNLSYVDGSVSANASYNAVDNQIEAAIPLLGTMGSLTAVDWGGFDDVTPYKYYDLDSFCTPNCDDTAFNINVPFTYFGTSYTRIGVTSNGFLQPGGATSATASSQLLPAAGAPNNVIAPMWTDLNLDDGGDWFVAFVSDSTYYYTVFQWTSVPHYDSSTDLYTFQVWIVEDTDEIYFTYGTIPAGAATHNTEIGIENATGTAGATYYNRSAAGTVGTLPNPASATPDLAVATILDKATITYQTMVDVSDITVDEVFNVVEVAYSNSPTVDKAFAKTLLIFFKTYFPLVMK
ncbi:MAG: S8 family serine peptidase [Anaerolineaceae bacterium]|nr:S8 family serine peptidase [Anaerolineaceae bacterium]